MDCKIKNNSHTFSPLSCFMVQNGFGTAFTYLTSGVFLTGLAILMGAGDTMASYLSVILNICGVLILAFSALLERFESRKKLTVSLTVLSRLATLFIAVIPACIPKQAQLTVFVLTVITAFTLQAQTTVVLNQWMLGFVADKQRGRYISMRQTLTLCVTVVLSAAGGWWMNLMQGEYKGFAILFTAAGLMGVFEIFILVNTPATEAYHPSVQRCRLSDLIKLPLKNCCFTGYVLYIFTFYLLLYIADSFTMVYLMKYLALPYQTVTALYMLISLPQMFLLKIWGKLSDKYGHSFVLTTSIWLFAGETFFMFFASSGNWFLFIPIAFLISSAANAGFVISVFNRRYELMPSENRIVFDNFYSAVIGLGFILGPMLGGICKNLIEKSSTLSEFIPFSGIRLLYILSTIGIILLQTAYITIQRKRKIKTVFKDVK